MTDKSGFFEDFGSTQTWQLNEIRKNVACGAYYDLHRKPLNVLPLYLG